MTQKGSRSTSVEVNPSGERRIGNTMRSLIATAIATVVLGGGYVVIAEPDLGSTHPPAHRNR